MQKVSDLDVVHSIAVSVRICYGSLARYMLYDSPYRTFSPTFDDGGVRPDERANSEIEQHCYHNYLETVSENGAIVLR